MGALIARFRRQTTVKDTLEKIQKDLDSIEEFKQSTQAHHKKLIGYLMTYFFAMYLVGAMFVYFKLFHHPSWQDYYSQLKLLLPFIISPFLFLLTKNFLTWWYHRKIKRNEVKAEKLKKDKATLLEKVMDTETYKVAKEILDKYGNEMPSQARMNATLLAANNSRQPASPQLSQQPSELRRRHSGTPSQAAPQIKGPLAGPRGSPTVTPNMSHRPLNPMPNRSMSNIGADELNGSFAPRDVPNPGQRQQGLGPIPRRPPGPPLPRPILPRERGYMDRMVEYLIGDGPSNRFALICKQCQSHNGMALKEEFEFIAFRCCYCFYWNPARKQRPVAPKIDLGTSRQSSTESTTDDDETTPGNTFKPAKQSKSGASGDQFSETSSPETLLKRDGAEDSSSAGGEVEICQEEVLNEEKSEGEKKED